MQTTTAPTYRGAMAIHPAVLSYVVWIEGLDAKKPVLPLHRNSPISIGLCSHLVCEHVFNSSPVIDGIEDILSARLYYEVPHAVAADGFTMIPDEAVWAFHRQMLATIAQHLSLLGRMGRLVKIDLKRFAEVLHRESGLLDGGYDFDALLKREQRLRGEQNNMFVVRRRHATHLHTTLPPRKRQAIPACTLFD